MGSTPTETYITQRRRPLLPGRNIMEGAIVLHETLHYIRKNKMGLVLRLILKKLIIK